MRFLSVRDLRGKSASIWRSLPDEREMIITNNGRPVALLTAVDETNVEESLAAWRQIRATQALTAIQQQSMQKGTDRFSMDEIDSEIAQSRESRQKRIR